MKILVADDDAVVRTLTRATLEQLGHEVIEAEDGEQAWTRYQQEDIRLLLLDWMMPKLDGLELCRMIRAEDRRAYRYIIILSALEGKGSYLEGMNAGADDFVSKPIGPHELAARLRVAERIVGLQTAVKQLEGLLPICSYCKKIRDEHAVWREMEVYVEKKTDASFSHGVCGDCYESEILPQLAQLGTEPATRL